MTKPMSKAGEALLEDVRAIKAGAGSRRWSQEQALVLQTRKSLNLTQKEFARMLAVPVATIRDWEQGRRTPDRAALSLIRVAAKHPDAVLDAVG